MLVVLCGICDHKLSMMVLSMLAINCKKDLVVVVDLPPLCASIVFRYIAFK